MKKLSLVFASLALAASVGADEWQAAVVASPAANTVFAEFVASSDQTGVAFCVYAAATVQVAMRVQHRNAANDTTIREQYIPVLAGTASPQFCQQGLVIASGERIRVINNALAVGTVSISHACNIY